MRRLKLICFVAVVAASAMMGATTRDAAAESAAVTNYKQAVTTRVGAWSTRMNKLNDDLTKFKTELGMLSDPNPTVPTNDPKGLAKAVRDKIAGIQDTMRFETNTLVTDIGLMTVAPPDKSEAVPLPGFIKDLVKAKGIPLAKNVSFAPNISWNFKSGTLGSASGAINITFQNP
jgi:hypothetical protein